MHNRIIFRTLLLTALVAFVYIASSLVTASAEEPEETAAAETEEEAAPLDSPGNDELPAADESSSKDGDTPATETTAETKYRFDPGPAEEVGRDFLSLLASKDFATAYQSGSRLLRESRSLDRFQHHVTHTKLDRYRSVEWTNGIPAKEGTRLTGAVTLDDGSKFPIYMHLIGDEDLNEQEVTAIIVAQVEAGHGRTRRWSEETSWRVLDVQPTTSLWSRIRNGEFTGLDVLIGIFTLVLLGALFFMIARYVRGLRGSPRELYLMFFTKLTEYSAYGAASYCFVIFLREDVGLGDTGATAYYTVFTLTMTVTVMVVGAVCDTIGVKKSLLIGAGMLLTARFFMPLTTNIYWVSLLGFLPFALGVAITGPVLKVGIKKFTTVESATLGFGLFYTLMNVGFAIGGWLFDALRMKFGDGGSVTLPIVGIEMSTYQVILGVGFFINIPDLIAILLMREGSEMTENGARIIPPKKRDMDTLAQKLSATLDQRKQDMVRETTRGLVAAAILTAIGLTLVYFGKGPAVWVWPWVFIVFTGLGAGGTLIYGLSSLAGTLSPALDRIMNTVRESTQETGRRLKENFSERPFWIYLFMLAVLVFVRLTFFIFHVAFPTYGLRVFGDGAKVGSLFGVLNPVMIVFLVPLISVLSQKVRSYNMLLLGTAVSAAAVFLCFIPDSVSLAIGNTWFGELVYDRWLEVPMGQRDPFYIALILFIIVFTIGEAIWSPRLMQFSAEIAPRGKEGSYIALAILPYFLGKAMAGGMSGFLLTNYTPETVFSYPDHRMVWMWIGSMAMISPIGLVVFRKLFRRVEDAAIAEAKAFVAEAAENGNSD